MSERLGRIDRQLRRLTDRLILLEKGGWEYRLISAKIDRLIEQKQGEWARSHLGAAMDTDIQPAAAPSAAPGVEE